jgi:cell division protein FtsN
MTSQRGGFAIGLIVGLLVGLALAIGVALYVTKVPVPFVNKVPQRTAEQDAAEVERNKNWDPNAPLAAKPATPIKPPTGATGAALPPGVAVVPPAATAPAPSKRDPAAILAGQAPAPAATTATKPAPTAPAATATKPTAAPATTAAATPPKSTKPGADPFTYFVQVGAYAKPEDAEQQRARVGLMGMTAKVSEREQSGRTMYRVRLGPYDRKEEADAVQERLAGSGVEAALVRVER